MPKKRTVNRNGHTKQLQRVYANAMRSAQAKATGPATAASAGPQSYSQSDLDAMIAADQKRQRRLARNCRLTGLPSPDGYPH